MARRKKTDEIIAATFTVVEGGKVEQGAIEPGAESGDVVSSDDTSNSGSPALDSAEDAGQDPGVSGGHGDNAVVGGDGETEATSSEPEPSAGSVSPKAEYKPWQPDGATLRNEVARRIAERKRIAREAASIALFPFTDEDGHKEFDKKIKEKRKEYQDACYLIDYDLARYMRAFELACMELAIGSSGDLAHYLNSLFALASSQIPLDDKARERIEGQRQKEHDEQVRAEKAKQKAEEDELRARGEVKGQIKLKFDDGSTAEPASECVTRPLVTDLEGNVLTGDQLEAQPLNLTDEERAALPPLEPLGDGPVEYVLGEGKKSEEELENDHVLAMEAAAAEADMQTEAEANAAHEAALDAEYAAEAAAHAEEPPLEMEF